VSDAALQLCLVERARDERAARDHLVACEGAHASHTARVERDRARRAEAAEALAAATRACAEATTATAWRLQVSAARRDTARRALADAEASQRASEARAPGVAQALDDARGALAQAMERRRAVEARLDALADEARRRRASLADDDVDEAHAAAQTGGVSERGA
jgi:hypothetical protein